MSSKVDLRSFLRQLSIVSEKAACIARHIRSLQSDFDETVQAKTLDENHQHLDADYKTLADVIVQEVIKRDLRTVFPALEKNIFGEEDGSIKLKTTNEKILINVDGRKDEILSLLQKLFNEKSSHSIERLAEIVSSSFVVDPIEKFDEIPADLLVDLNDFGIWIDPIDGTQEYINGGDGLVDPKTKIIRDGLPASMVLIGCFSLHNGKASIGLINRPFAEKIDSTWKSSIYWAADLPEGKFENLRQSHFESAERTLIFGSVSEKHFASILPNWNKLQVSACGNKLLAVALRKANVFAVTKAVAFNWDVCAAQVLLTSLGGDVLDLPRLNEYFRQNRSLKNVDLQLFSIRYEKIPSVHFDPADFACPPFVAFHCRKDLEDFIEEFSSQNISFE